MTTVWIGVSLLFRAGIYLFYPGDSHEIALEFLAGYLIEKSLSKDNLFVFLMLFSFFGIECKYQPEVLFWGIFGVLVLRSIFIFAGVAMVTDSLLSQIGHQNFSQRAFLFRAGFRFM